jgi:hypothetical protein
MCGELWPAPKLHSTLLRSLSALACASKDQMTFELRKAAKHGQHQSPMGCCRIGPLITE